MLVLRVRGEDRESFRLGVQLAQQEKTEALGVLLNAWSKRSIEEDKEIDAEALFWTGWALRRRGLTDASSRMSAVKYMNRALLQAPENAVARFYYGDSLLDIGRGSEAITEMRMALLNEPDAFEASAKSKLLRAEALARLQVSRDDRPEDKEDKAELQTALVHVWDAAVGDPAAVSRNALKLIEFLADRAETSIWFDFNHQTEPTSATEYAVVTSLLPLVASVLQQYQNASKKKEKFAGVEVWARHQHIDKGVVPHYDYDLSVQRQSVRSRSKTLGTHLPAASSILFLSDQGGATFVLDQTHNHSAFVFPRHNRFAVFQGHRLHGVLPARLKSETTCLYDQGSRTASQQPGPRISLLINWWYRRPQPPQCASMPPRIFADTDSVATSIPVPRFADHSPARRRCKAQLNLLNDNFSEKTNLFPEPTTAVPCPEDQTRYPAFFSSSPPPLSSTGILL